MHSPSSAGPGAVMNWNPCKSEESVVKFFPFACFAYFAVKEFFLRFLVVSCKNLPFPDLPVSFEPV